MKLLGKFTCCWLFRVNLIKLCKMMLEVKSWVFITYFISIVTWCKVAERWSLFTLGNILGFGKRKVFFLRACFWVRNHFRPVCYHVLGQLSHLIDVLTNSINGFFFDLPVCLELIWRVSVNLINHKIHFSQVVWSHFKHLIYYGLHNTNCKLLLTFSGCYHFWSGLKWSHYANSTYHWHFIMPKLILDNRINPLFNYDRVCQIVSST